MPNLSVAEIYDDFRTNYQPGPDFSIDFHNKNSIFFNNYRTFTDDNELSLYIELIALYIGALYGKDRYNAAIDEADKDLQLIDEAIGNLNSHQLKTQGEWYYEIIFVKAMAFYRLQDYKTSENLFKELVSIDPQNDTFVIWLNHAKYRNRAWLINILYLACALLLFSQIIFKSYINLPDLRLILPIIGLTGIIFTICYDTWNKGSFRRINKI